MKATPTALPEVLILEPTVFSDERGFFMESYNQRTFSQVVGHDVEFVQDNHSRSTRGVLRGLHYQLPPHAQGKLVRVTSGQVFDVTVDVRKSSPRFGQWAAVELDAEKHRQLWVPPGFAHGFLVLSDYADLLYKVTSYYAVEADRGIRWDDDTLGIRWPDLGMEYQLSPKDSSLPLFRDAACFN